MKTPLQGVPRTSLRRTWASRLLAAALLLGLPAATLAQTVTIPGANTSNGNGRPPLGTYFGYERTAMLYTSTEVGQPGTISSVGFYLNTTTAPAATPVKIYLKETPATTFAAATTVATEETGATLVYDATLPASTFVAGQWITMPLATPFAYSGSNTLEVIVETNAGGSGTEGSTAKQFRYSTAAARTQTWLQDDTPPTITGTIIANRPNIQLTLTPTTPCVSPPTPGTVQASATSACAGGTVTFSLQGGTNGSGQTYQWQESTNGTTYTSIAGANSRTYTSAALSASRYFRVVVTCGTQSAASAAVQVTVSAPTYAALPVVESFENTWVDGCATRDVPSNSWRNNPLTGDNSWRRDDDGASANWGNATSYMYSPSGSLGSRSARFHSGYASAGQIGTLDLYANLSGAGAKRLTFDYINTSGSDSLSVMVSNDGGVTFGPAQLRLGVSGTAAAGFSSQALTLNGTSATTVIRFRARADFGSTDIGLDNVRLESATGCLSPASLTVTSTTPTTATVSWVGGGTGTYTVRYGATGFSPTGGTVVANLTGTSYTITGLTPSTAYQFYVTQNCGTTASSQVGPVAFTTPAIAPANDECAGATSLPTLTAGGGCNSVIGTNVAATGSAAAPAPIGCGSTTGTAGYSGGDVWFKFVVPANGGVITILTDSVSGSPISDTGLAVYSGTCGTLNQIGCDDDGSPFGLFSKLTLSGRTAGETIYVRVWEYGNDSFGRFRVCASFDLAPTNDDPAGAVTLNFAPDCVTPVLGSNTVATTTTATGYTNGGAGGCGTNTAPNDVWYKFTTLATGRGSVEATISVTGLGAGSIRLFTAPGAAGPFAPVTNGCSASASGTSAAPSLTLTTLTPNTTYYVQISNFSTANGGAPFTICLTAPSNCPVPVGPAATATTATTAVLGWSVNATTPSGTFTLEYGAPGFALGTGTRLTGLTGLSTSLTGLTADTQYCFYVRQECGPASGTSAFAGPVCFRTALGPAANDEPCNATTLVYNAQPLTSTTIGATFTAPNGYAGIGCALANAPRDVWFKFVAPASTATNRLVVTGTTAGQIRLFSAATCSGPFTQMACQASSGPNTASGPMTLPALTAGNTYYVAVSGFATNDTQGPFTISFTQVSSTGTGSLPNGEVTVYPNPSHDGTLNLSIRGAGSASVGEAVLVNALGQKVLTQAVVVRGGSVDQALPVQSLAKGLYTLRVRVGEHTITRKVVLD